MEKTHKGRFLVTSKVEAERRTPSLGYYLRGYFLDHPVFRGDYGYTSMVVKELPDDEVETLNSIYKLVYKKDVEGGAV